MGIRKSTEGGFAAADFGGNDGPATTQSCLHCHCRHCSGF